MKTPLLPSSKASDLSARIEGGSSVTSAVFNLSTTIIGCGIMSLPATLRILGVGPAFFLIAFMAFLCDKSAGFMLKYTSYGASSTYAELMGESFGNIGSKMPQLCIMFSNFGGLVMYLMIIGDVISGNGSEGGSVGMLAEWFGEEWWNARAIALFVVLVVVLLPLVFFKKIDSLKYTSAISVLLAVVFVIITSGLALYALYHGTAKPPRLFPDFSKQSFFELFTAVPVIVVAFAFHYNIHPVRAELAFASDMKVAVRISLILCSIIYSTVGFSGYLLFGESTMCDILSNFDRGSSITNYGPMLNDIVRLSYALHLILVFPLLNFSLRLNVDEMLFPKKKPLVTDNVRFVTVSLVLMALVYSATIAIPNIWVLFQFIGSTASVSMSLIFPGAIVVKDIYGISKRKDKLIAGSMIVLAVITSTIAISTNVSNIFDNSKTKVT